MKNNKSDLKLEEFQKDPTAMFDFLQFFFKFTPYDYQKRFLQSCLLKKRIAGKWCRQAGKSQSVAAYCAFRSIVSPVSIMIAAPTQTQSSELYSKVRQLISSNEIINKTVIKSTETELQFENGSRIKALPTGPEGKSIRGFTAD